MKIIQNIKFLFLKNVILLSGLFERKWYLQQYPEVSRCNVDPVKHYIKYGWKEGKNPSVKFDTKKYLIAYPDVKKNPLIHYILRGKYQGRMCFPMFQIGPSRCVSSAETPMVSVIVASYNYAKLLPEALDSILQQTYLNYEIIVVDDGSSDDSLNIIEHYQSIYPNIHLYTHLGNVNKGLPETIKLGIEKSKGEFIAFCESDDKWHPQYLEKKIGLINSYQDVKIISNNIELFGDESAIEIRKSYIENINTFLSEGGNRIDLSYCKEMNYIPTFSAVMIRKDVLNKLNFDTPIPAWIDFWLYRQILKDTNLYYVKDKLTYWRLHNSYNGTITSSIHVKDSDWFLFKSDCLIGIRISKKIRRAVRKIERSKFFNESFYMSKYKEFVGNEKPAIHYLFVGWKKGYNPSERFSNDAYLIENVDNRFGGVNPIIHYEKYKNRKKIHTIVGEKECPLRGSDILEVEEFHRTAKTVLLISHELSLTGAPRALLNMAVSLKNMGIMPVVLALRGGDMKYELTNLGIKYIIDPLLLIRMSYKRMKDRDLYISFLSKFDMILFNTLETFSLMEVFSMVKTTKVCWLHEGRFCYDFWKSKCDLFSLFSLFDKIYTVGSYSESFASTYVKDKNRLSILYYGLPDMDNRSHKLHNGKLSFLLPGSLEERKGQMILLDALDLLPKDILGQIKIYMAGSVLNKHVYKAVKHCRYSCVEYLGLLDHEKLMECYKDVDIILVPSLDDPMPIVCTEAMILEKALIVSDNTGTAGFIENGINGYRVLAGDPKSLAEAIKWTVIHRSELPNLGKAARKIYDDNFTMEVFRQNVRRMIMENIGL